MFNNCLRRDRKPILHHNVIHLHLRRTIVFICFLLISISLLFYLLFGRHQSHLYDDLDYLATKNLNSSLLYEKYLIYTPQCILKSIPVLDEQTRPLYRPPLNRKYYCPPENRISAGIKRVNYTWIAVPEIGCQATEVERDPSNEGVRYGRKVNFGRRLLVDFPQSDAVEVSCPSISEKKVVPLIPIKRPIWRQKSTEENDLPLPPSPSQPNILAIGIDSISRLNFLRHFLATKDFIAEQKFEGPLYGLHKVGDNTFPNLIAMFTGLDIEGVEQLIPYSRKLDELPLIFKKFSAAGYLTTYIENMPEAGLWTFHGRKGFGDQQPLEYLMRPVNLLVADELENDFCYKGRLEMEMYFEYVFEQMLAFRERQQRHLTFVHMAALVHNEPNNAAYADEPVNKFLNRIFDENFHKNTIILFYSDHGFRFGPLSRTESGYQESRLPFMYWRIPERLSLGDGLNAEKIKKALRINSRRLSSQFDVHSTLMHLLNGRSSPSFELKKHQFGHSLFTEISLNRTCEQAGIPDEYCLCRRFVPLTDDRSRLLVGNYILTYLNDQLRPYSSNCSKLSLNRVLSAKVSVSFTRANLLFGFIPLPSFRMSSHSSMQTVSVRLLTAAPSNGTFDVTLKVRVLSGRKSNNVIIEDREAIQRLSSLIRLDRYGDQSACVVDTPVESFCYCKNLVE